MPLELDVLAAPPHTALLTMECQRGVIGDLSPMPELREQVEAAGVVERAAQLCRTARAGGVPVVHCTAEFRADRAGSAANCRLLAASIRMQDQTGSLTHGSPGTEVLPDLEPDERDIIVPRLHGLTPFTSTSLDQLLRNLGVTTVVVVGQSVNVGILGTVLSAVDLGYQVIVPADAVAGVPAEYAAAVLQNTVALLATVVPSQELLDAWA